VYGVSTDSMVRGKSQVPNYHKQSCTKTFT
jgi:hypothetical protein